MNWFKLKLSRHLTLYTQSWQLNHPIVPALYSCSRCMISVDIRIVLNFSHSNHQMTSTDILTYLGNTLILTFTVCYPRESYLNKLLLILWVSIYMIAMFSHTSYRTLLQAYIYKASLVDINFHRQELALVIIWPRLTGKNSN